MNHLHTNYQELLRDTVDKFWQVVPPIWRHTRSRIHQIASDKYSITGAQFTILQAIYHGKQSVSELAVFGHISRPAISRTVENLTSSGLVSRQRDPEDRRYVRLSLTKAGRDLLHGLHDETHAWVADRMKRLNADELQIVARALDLIDRTL